MSDVFGNHIVGFPMGGGGGGGAQLVYKKKQ